MINGFKKYFTLGLFAVFVGLFGFCNGINSTGSTIYGNVNELYPNATNNADIQLNSNLSFVTDQQYNYLYIGQTNGWQQNWWGWNTDGTDIITINGRRIITTSGRCILEGQYRINQVTPSSCISTTEEVLEQIKNDTITRRAIGDALNIYNRTQPSLCLYSNTKTYCRFGYSRDSTQESTDITSRCTNSLGCNEPSNMVQYFGNPPELNGSNNQPTLIPIDTDVDKVISYYENRFGWDKNMCFVGTFDLDSSFGASGISFQEGTGDSVFGLYYHLYSGYGSNIITNVGKFINVWLLNYSQWFYEDSPKWIGTDNGPDTNVTYIYTGITFPFANKPVAIYFIASNLYDGYARESSQGVDMAFYCYSKLNYQSIKSGNINYEEVKEMVGTGITERIDTYVNYHLNPNSPNGNSGSYQVPTSGSFWESFGSGYEETDMDLDNTFSDFYTRITNIFQNYSPLHTTGIIPDYILYALIFLLLFRIMKH